jgi:uncharacterized Zn finger protein
MPWRDDSEAEAGEEKVAREIERRRRRGEAFEPVLAPGKGSKIATSFWGQAWQHHLEGYADYQTRLPRGRSCLRQGKVYDLTLQPGEVTAVVAEDFLYDVIVKIRPLDPDQWREIKERCAGQVGTLLDLLGGRLGDGVLKVITDRENGLFPSPKEIKLICTCPDSAGLCKHAAAVLYGVGLRFDADPALFFQLRAVNPQELVSLAADVVGQAPPAGSAQVLPEDDVAALFGIDWHEEPPASSHEPPP